MRDLGVEAPEHAAARGRVVVLDEDRVDPALGELPRVMDLEEEAAGVAEDPWLDADHAREIGRDEAHG
jgi:hypothetical protein